MRTKLPWRLIRFAIVFIAVALLLFPTKFFSLDKNLSINTSVAAQGQKTSRAQALYRQQVPEKPDDFVESSNSQNFDEQRSFSPSDEGLTNNLTQVFSNTNSISIPTSGVATPYPSAINVTGFTGNITKVTVTLTNFTHTFPSDVDVLLVSPTGQKVTILSDVGDINPITNVTLTLDDAAVNSLPVVGTLVSGTFKPTDANLAPADVFPSPAPAGPYAMTLSTFNGFSPNGTWNLYVVDQFAGDSGSFSGGFSLSITDDAVAPPPPPPTTTTLSFTNNGTILVPGTGTSGIASPYPATVNVTGFSGNTTKATITLTNFNHTFPDDVDVLLVSPTGQKVIVLSDVGTSLDVVNVTLTLDDAAINSLPDAAQLVSGTFKPTNIGTGDTFAAPAPAAPYGSLLSDFNGVNPNGIWSLYVVDDLGGDAGNFAGGFTLTITAAAAANTTVQFSSATYSVSENVGSAMITVTRAGSTTGTSTVNYATSNGTAIAGSDYTTTTGTLTFPANSTSQTFMVPITNDNLTEGDETVNLALSAPTGATLGTPNTAVLTIANDDRLDHLTVYGVDTNNSRIQRSVNNGLSWTTVGFGSGTGLGNFNRPKGVSSSLDDLRIFVADTGNNRIQRSTDGGASWQLLAGAGIAAGTVNAPQGVAFDEIHDILYVADTGNNRIQMISNASSVSPIPFILATSGGAVGQFNQPRGIAVDGNGFIYVADTGNNRIQVSPSAYGNIPGVWQILVNATAGTAVGKFNQPRGIYANGAGDVYVADTANNRIQKLSGGVWSVFMFTGAVPGTVNAPEGVVTTSGNFVFVGDTANNRVQRLTSTGTSPTVVGPAGLAVGQFNQVSGMR